MISFILILNNPIIFIKDIIFDFVNSIFSQIEIVTYFYFLFLIFLLLLSSLSIDVDASSFSSKKRHLLNSSSNFFNSGSFSVLGMSSISLDSSKYWSMGSRNIFSFDREINSSREGYLKAVFGLMDVLFWFAVYYMK